MQTLKSFSFYLQKWHPFPWQKGHTSFWGLGGGEGDFGEDWFLFLAAANIASNALAALLLLFRGGWGEGELFANVGLLLIIGLSRSC